MVRASDSHVNDTASGQEELVVMLTTISSLREAKRLTRELVEEHLIACGSILPKATSIYIWNNKLEESEEYVMMLKTRRTLVEKLMNILKAKHPYKVPEMLVIPVYAVNPPYAKWVVYMTE